MGGPVQGLKVNKYETDVLGLKEEMRVSLQTSMNTGKFNLALHDAYKIQIHTSVRKDGERVEGFMLRNMNIYNDEIKISTIVSRESPQVEQNNVYYDFLMQDEDIGPKTIVITEHRFTHAYVAMTVFVLTLFFLFVNYGCFLSRLCRRVDTSGKSSRVKKESKGRSVFSATDDDELQSHGTASQQEVEIVLNSRGIKAGGANISFQHQHLQEQRDEDNALHALDGIIEFENENESENTNSYVSNFNDSETIAF